jgi:hypothetical protein
VYTRWSQNSGSNSRMAKSLSSTTDRLRTALCKDCNCEHHDKGSCLLCHTCLTTRVSSLQTRLNSNGADYKVDSLENMLKYLDEVHSYPQGGTDPIEEYWEQLTATPNDRATVLGIVIDMWKCGITTFLEIENRLRLETRDITLYATSDIPNEYKAVNIRDGLFIDALYGIDVHIGSHSEALTVMSDEGLTYTENIARLTVGSVGVYMEEV